MGIDTDFSIMKLYKNIDKKSTIIPKTFDIKIGGVCGMAL
jgi:hypothetical protein